MSRGGYAKMATARVSKKVYFSGNQFHPRIRLRDGNWLVSFSSYNKS